MKEICYNKNLFLLPKGPADAAVVTTNGILRSNGRLVMGAGIARYCRDNHKDIDKILGYMVSKHGNAAYYVGKYSDVNREKANLNPFVNILSMPTKQDWRDKSDTELIRKSCREMMKLATENNLISIFLPAPGCSNGGLDYCSQVRPILQEELDDRFTVCLPDQLYREAVR